MGTKHVGGLTGLASIAEQSLNRLERSNQPRLLGTAQLTQHCRDLIVGTVVARGLHSRRAVSCRSARRPEPFFCLWAQEDHDEEYRKADHVVMTMGAARVI